VLLQGTRRIRVEQDLHTLTPLSSIPVEPDTVRQMFNDTDSEQLWLVVGAAAEAANTLEMTEETLACMHPDGPKALPPGARIRRQPAPMGRRLPRSRDRRPADHAVGGAAGPGRKDGVEHPPHPVARPGHRGQGGPACASSRLHPRGARPPRHH
jgi:hypothetical protein